ncbi:nitronate monooxygenase family protein [Endozoicomonas sp. SCSIO W0465]|uniref:NAD(P)H-dependent flavin oxidoreductase n=1 Tax=Endozoicomonas sp. SCSIO W0465 TaxID=2918516 RepID=UPI002076672D|nr:nitronate monooxygenase [Endozoicomonas sp. SCSIO W0465]
MYQANASEIVDMVVYHGVRAVSYSRSPGKKMVTRLKDAGVVCIPTVGALKHAIKAAAMGADAVTVQGGEGGGHMGSVATSILLPQVIDALDVPVVAAGGFKDGKGLISALAYGAEGIAMGTRFLMTKDCPVPTATLDRYVKTNNPASIMVSKAIDGMPQRMITNEFLVELEKAGSLKQLILAIKNGLAFRKYTGMSMASLLKTALQMSGEGQMTAAQTIMAANAPMVIQKAMVDGLPSEGVLPAGQVARIIDSLVSCDELIQEIMQEARQQIARLNSLKMGDKNNEQTI